MRIRKAPTLLPSRRARAWGWLLDNWAGMGLFVAMLTFAVLAFAPPPGGHPARPDQRATCGSVER